MNQDDKAEQDEMDLLASVRQAMDDGLAEVCTGKEDIASQLALEKFIKEGLELDAREAERDRKYGRVRPELSAAEIDKIRNSSLEEFAQEGLRLDAEAARKYGIVKPEPLTTDKERRNTPKDWRGQVGSIKALATTQNHSTSKKFKGLGFLDKDKLPIPLSQVMAAIPEVAPPAPKPTEEIEKSKMRHRFSRIALGEIEDLADVGISVCPKIYTDLRAIPLHKRATKESNRLCASLVRGIYQGPENRWIQLGEIFTIVRDDKEIQHIRNLPAVSVPAIYLANDPECRTSDEFNDKHHTEHYFWSDLLPKTEGFLAIIYTLGVYRDPADPQKKPVVQMRWRSGPFDASCKHPYKALTREVRALPYTDEQREMLYAWTGITFDLPSWAGKKPETPKPGGFRGATIELHGSWGSPS